MGGVKGQDEHVGEASEVFKREPDTKRDVLFGKKHPQTLHRPARSRLNLHRNNARSNLNDVIHFGVCPAGGAFPLMKLWSRGRGLGRHKRKPGRQFGQLSLVHQFRIADKQLFA